jgi:rhodanese-related sulfurtransferase
VPSSVKDMLAAANESVTRISPDEAKRLMSEEGALLVDVRDAPELDATGKLANATNVSRGMLEFRADSSTPYHNPEFRTDRPVILYCASGGRSSLAGKALQDLGYTKVYNLGGFRKPRKPGFQRRRPEP